MKTIAQYFPGINYTFVITFNITTVVIIGIPFIRPLIMLTGSYIFTYPGKYNN